ncbi:MAG: hypothetical protein LC797_14370 [Chloroflexi bacterium]|nr:hypothetical protein [Chloroflexota bacterium]
MANEGDRIVEVARLDRAVARRVIDACGKMVCPRFVDVNEHSDWTLFAKPTQQRPVRQGVTIEVAGNCGNTGEPVGRHTHSVVAPNSVYFDFARPSHVVLAVIG